MKQVRYISFTLLRLGLILGICFAINALDAYADKTYIPQPRIIISILEFLCGLIFGVDIFAQHQFEASPHFFADFKFLSCLSALALYTVLGWTYWLFFTPLKYFAGCECITACYALWKSRAGKTSKPLSKNS